jgi:hypothetical protein
MYDLIKLHNVWNFVVFESDSQILQNFILRS